MEGPWSFLPVFPRPAVVQGVKERQTQDEEGHIEHEHGVDEVPGVHLPGGDKEEGDPKNHAQEGQRGEKTEQVVKGRGEMSMSQGKSFSPGAWLRWASTSRRVCPAEASDSRPIQTQQNRLNSQNMAQMTVLMTNREISMEVPSR